MTWGSPAPREPMKPRSRLRHYAITALVAEIVSA